MIVGRIASPKQLDPVAIPERVGGRGGRDGGRAGGRELGRATDDHARSGFGSLLDRSGSDGSRTTDRHADRAGRARAGASDAHDRAQEQARGSRAEREGHADETASSTDTTPSDRVAEERTPEAQRNAESETESLDRGRNDIDTDDEPDAEDAIAEGDTDAAESGDSAPAPTVATPIEAPADAFGAGQSQGDAPTPASAKPGDKATDPEASARTHAQATQAHASRSTANAAAGATGEATQDGAESDESGVAHLKRATDRQGAERRGEVSPGRGRAESTTADAARRADHAPRQSGPTPLAGDEPNADTGAGQSDHRENTNGRADSGSGRANGAHPVREPAGTGAPAGGSADATQAFRLVPADVLPGDLAPNAAAQDPSGAGRTDASARPGSTPATPTDRAFVTGLSRGLGAVLNQKGGSLTMKLTPPTLGDVRIVMTMNAGRVSVEIQAGGARAHELLNANLPALRATLEGRGLTVERLGAQLSTNGTLSPGSAHSNGSASNEQGGQTSGRPEDSGTDHDAGGGRSRGRRERTGDERRAGDDSIGSFEEMFGQGVGGGAADGREAGVRLGLDAVI